MTVCRRFSEMEEAGLPALEYKQNEFMVYYATIRQVKDADRGGDVNGDEKSLKGVLKEVYLIVVNNPGIKIGQVAEIRERSESTVWKQLNELRKNKLIEYRGSDKSGGYYAK